MRILLVLAACAPLAACASYETTFFIPDETGAVTTKTVAGVPIVVTVPQKLGFIATESTYEISTTSAVDGRPVTSSRQITELSIDKTSIPLGRSELVALDIKRPAYGTAKTTMKLTNQYPTELTTEVDDKTLDRALETIEKFVQKQGEGAGGGNTTRTLISQRNFMIVYDPQTRQISRQRI